MNNKHADYLRKHEDILAFRELTDGTIECYKSYLIRFLTWAESELSCEDVSTLDWDTLRSYFNYLKNVCGLNPRTINGHIAQLRDFYAYVLHRTWDRYEIPFMRFDQKLPQVPTFEEVNAIIDSIQDPKHKAEIALLYSSGIRVSELCRLKCGDIIASKNLIQISKSKNRCERYAVLSRKALVILTAYIRAAYHGATHESWLFPGPTGSKPISTESVRRVFKNALSGLGWAEKDFQLHSLRHAFGLHLYENGVDLLTIKEAMGHKSLSSTEVYLTLGVGNGRSVTSPYDRDL